MTHRRRHRARSASRKTLFPSADVTFKLKGAGSRLFPTGGTFASVGTTGFTLNGLNANDDWSTDHLEGVVFYVGTAKATSVADFAKKYASATYKGSVTVGSAVSTTIADKDYINVLAISDDGSVALLSTQYVA